MAGEPYRSPASPPATETVEEVLDVATRLGLLRSVHRAPPLWRALLPALAPVVMAAAVVSGAGGAILPIAGTFAVIAVALLSYGPLRRRNRRVEVHAHGIVVVTPKARDAVVFEDVDALWYEMDFSSMGPSSRARIVALKLVDHAGVVHRVPLTVEDPLTPVHWAVRHCSDPLLADAQAALRAGETLTFGSVRIDREGVVVGRRRALPWKELRLARLQPGKIALYRRMPIFPWRTIRLDRVPHPTLFVKLFRELAPEVEVDDPNVKPWNPS